VFWAFNEVSKGEHWQTASRAITSPRHPNPESSPSLLFYSLSYLICIFSKSISRIDFPHLYPALMSPRASAANLSFRPKILGDQVGGPRIEVVLPTSQNRSLNSRQTITFIGPDQGNLFRKPMMSRPRVQLPAPLSGPQRPCPNYSPYILTFCKRK
jgi:hypothetical protein